MKLRFSLALAALLVWMATGSPVRSQQDAAGLKKDMIGQWELSTTERSKTCVVTLKPDTTPQGLKLELEPGCAAALPFTKDIKAWSLKGLAKSMDQMIGDWAMVRGDGNTICGLTLTNNDAGNDNFQVFLKPKCDPKVSAFAPTQWRLERGQIMLMSDKGETWRFEADDNAQWRLVPDSADPLIMLRQ